MKRVINESLLRTIIGNCVQLVKEAYGSGYVSNQGNGMIGGRYWWRTTEGHLIFDVEDLIDELIQAGLIPEGENTELAQLFSQILDGKVKGIEHVGEDKSIGDSYDEIEPDYDSFDNVIAMVQNANHPLLTNKTKQFAIQYLKDYFDKYCEDERAYEWQEEYDEPDYE